MLTKRKIILMAAFKIFTYLTAAFIPYLPGESTPSGTVQFILMLLSTDVYIVTREMLGFFPMLKVPLMANFLISCHNWAVLTVSILLRLTGIKFGTSTRRLSEVEIACINIAFQVAWIFVAILLQISLNAPAFKSWFNVRFRGPNDLRRSESEYIAQTKHFLLRLWSDKNREKLWKDFLRVYIPIVRQRQLVNQQNPLVEAYILEFLSEQFHEKRKSRRHPLPRPVICPLCTTYITNKQYYLRIPKDNISAHTYCLSST